ncbi:MAG TPA: DUF1501 domain-containing protein [Polyangiaceae bacterium]|nr:DUF1501 domain-containing protein [Polyangiaceae bacterium]
MTRRQALLGTLFGAGALGLRSLATGLPVSFLLNPRKALADIPTPACGNASKAQFIILATSGSGDPINTNCPGTYLDPNIVHSLDPTMAPTTVTMSGKPWTAAAPWAQLQPWLDRTSFFHLMTNTPVHPKEPNVLALMGATYQGEMFPSILAKYLAPCLGTLQAQPMSLGASNPSETLTFNGAPQPNIPANALKSTLASAAGPLTNLQPLRDQTLSSIHDLYVNGATPAQKNYLDSLITTQKQVRQIDQNLLAALTALNDNSVTSQITAAIALIQMKITPVISIHIPFGGDNHTDTGLATETTQTVSGCAAIAALMQALQNAGLSDQVSFLSLNVFGRTMAPGTENGRNHNNNHQVSLMIGKPFKGGVVGGVAADAKDYSAMAIDSATGNGATGGDITALDSLASFGKTVMQAVGVDSAAISTQITSGKVVAGAIA